MPSYKDMFPAGKHLKTEDLKGKAHRVVVESVGQEEIGPEKELKPVMRFVGKESGLVLNWTRGQAMEDLFGEDTDGWIGQTIEIYPGTTNYAGKRVGCMAIRAAQGAAPVAPPPPPAADDLADDDVPF